MVQKTFLRDVFLFGSGIIISLMLQILYDVVQEENPYASMMSKQDWRALLAIVSGIAWVVLYLSIKRTGALED